MADDAILREVKLALPMEPDMEIEASKAAASMAEGMRMSADKIDEVRMAVVEACINAYEHSHSKDQQVFLTFQVLGRSGPQRLRITVCDHGVGFDPGAIEEPKIEDKLKAARKRGWGLKIIHGLMDQVEIHSNVSGTILVMSKSV